MIGNALGYKVTIVIPGNASMERKQRIKAHGTKIIETWVNKNKNANLIYGTIHQVYGQGDDPNNVISYAAKCLHNNLPAKLSSGNIQRDWIYIFDLVNAIIKSIDMHEGGIKRYDFGTGRLYSLKSVLNKLAKLFGKSINLLHFNPE